MKAEILAKPVFSYINIDLEPGESIIAESDAMASMAAELDMEAKFNGGLFSGLCKKFLGGESLFVNRFTNNTGSTKRLTLTQNTPGDINCVELEDDSICLQPGAYICSTPGLKLGVKWAGIASFIGREGLFKLIVKGTGRLWYGAYGGLLEKEVDGEYIVDTSHLVAYEPQLKLKCQLAGGGIFSSFFSGEGLVTRISGNGKIVIQTRSMHGLVSWLNRHLY
ncbi:MAG: TIGR00266 family protein [Sedimentisphaerales bacterium]|nr:TIGR00266 family protein [Sedimentisphaerales bacterium]